jgi:hypothetical protein
MPKRKLRRDRRVLVIQHAASNGGGLMTFAGQVLVAGAAYGALAYFAASRSRPSVAGFVARHPRAAAELAAIKAVDVGTDLISRGKRQWQRLKSRWARRTQPERRRIAYRPPGTT